MSVNMKGKSFLTLMDLSAQEIRYLLDLAHDLKACLLYTSSEPTRP